MLRQAADIVCSISSKDSCHALTSAPVTTDCSESLTDIDVLNDHMHSS